MVNPVNADPNAAVLLPKRIRARIWHAPVDRSRNMPAPSAHVPKLDSHADSRWPAHLPAGVFLLAMTSIVCPTLAAPKPNIIVIFTDDHGHADLSCQDVLPDIKTPNIDALAASGVRMTSGYVTAPQCVPSRAGILTGKYQNRFGVESNGMPLDGFNAERTIAERLKAAGYATGMIGKWHLGPIPAIPQHGFADVFAKNSGRPGWSNYGLDGGDAEPGPEATELYHLDACSLAARAFIKRHHNEPFFLYLAYRAPHVPLDAPQKYLDRFPGKMPQRRRQALAMLSAVDDGVGGVITSLREHNIEEQTLIFFIGDNGAPLKIHKLDAPGGGPGWDGSLNNPLNGEKGMLSEGGMRVPFVVNWKGTLPAGQRYDHPVISLDVAATAIALAGLEEDPALDGVNLIPHLQGKTQKAPHEALYWRWIAQSAIREGRWKYLRGGAREYLFNLADDMEEKHSVLAEHPQVANRLRQKLARWAGELNPPGLETKQMSTTWETYFDFYLDGKPISQPAKITPGKNSVRSTTSRGWVARNATMKVIDGVLQIRATNPRTNRRPFIAASRLELPIPLQATVRLRSETGGVAGIAWREQGQDDFPRNQVVSFDCPASQQSTQHTVKLPARGTVIQLRLLLPPAGADVTRIEVVDDKQDSIKVWQFDARGDIP